MLTIISILLPIMAGVIVYSMFRQDLEHSQSVRKLKRGAVEALVERHRRAMMIHFAVFITFALIYFILFGTGGLIFIILWLIIFLGHTQALSRFSKQMMSTIEMNRVMDARLADAPLEGDADMLDYDYSERKAKREK